jgi:cysteine-rich repeat protein
LNESSFGAAGAEFLLNESSAPVSVFVESRFGNVDYNRITGGLKLYLDNHAPMSLKSRHRTADPENHVPVFPRLLFGAKAAVCGNGITEPPETCDDGNAINGDGCLNTCQLPICGNGTIEPPEQCDDGNAVNGDGCSSCLFDSPG